MEILLDLQAMDPTEAHWYLSPKSTWSKSNWHYELAFEELKAERNGLLARPTFD